MILEEDDNGAIEADDDNWSDEEADEDDSSLPSHLHPRDLENFLKLCESLTIWLSDGLSEEMICEADRLLCEYCTELLEVSG